MHDKEAEAQGAVQCVCDVSIHASGCMHAYMRTCTIPCALQHGASHHMDGSIGRCQVACMHARPTYLLYQLVVIYFAVRAARDIPGIHDLETKTHNTLHITTNCFVDW